MHSAQHRMHFLDSGDVDRAFDRIDHPAVAARCDHYQTAPFDVEAGGEFMLEIVRDDVGHALLLRKLVGEATDPVVRSDSHSRRRQHFLEGR
jgi:hypothetical protein